MGLNVHTILQGDVEDTPLVFQYSEEAFNDVSEGGMSKIE